MTSMGRKDGGRGEFIEGQEAERKADSIIQEEGTGSLFTRSAKTGTASLILPASSCSRIAARHRIESRDSGTFPWLGLFVRRSTGGMQGLTWVSPARRGSRFI